MRFTNSPSKSRKIDPNARVVYDRQLPRNLNQWKHFCHYNNAVYMGGMSGSQKNGKGLLLHDDGASVISEYKNDIPSGHNIIFRQNSITSIVFRNYNQYDIAYKFGRFIIKIPFAQTSDKANGLGYLIDYEGNQLFQLIFENGVIVEKILRLDRKDNEDVFKRNAITKTIGVKHEQAFQLTFEKPQNMHVKYDQSQLTIGYYNEEGQLHGLAFRIYAENAQVSGAKSLSLKTIERGYYKNSVLQTYGQKYFSNGNKYVGQFEGGDYNGEGILICPKQMKWAYGNFIDGKLNEVIDSNSQRYTRNDFEMWIDSLWHIHKRYKERWIDLDIELPDQLYLYRILQEAEGMRVTTVDPDHQDAWREDQQRLNKIQHQFLQGFPGNVQRSYVDHQLDQHYTYRTNKQIYDYPHKERVVRKQPPTFTPKHTRGEGKYFSSPSSSSSKKGERYYRLQDPFKDELYFQTKSKQIPTYRSVSPNIPEYEYDFKRNYNYREGEYPQRYRFRYYNDIAQRYKDEEPLDSIYRPTYRHRFETQRDRLKTLQNEDIQYLRRSPVHRKYYDSSYLQPERYNGKIINKKHFSYKDPTQLYVHRWPQTITTTPTRRMSPLRRYQDEEKEQPVRVSPSRRAFPYRGNQDELSNSRNYVENNYKHWR